MNPPTATPEPGAVQTGAGKLAGGSDLEVIPFRPSITLRRGEAPRITVAEKPAGTAGSGSLKRPPGEVSDPQEAYQAPDIARLLAPTEWTILLYEGFEGFSPPTFTVPFSPTLGTGPWTVYDFGRDGFRRSWGATDYYYYYNGVDSQSVWPASFGADALDPWINWYTNNLYSWLDYGPIDLTNMADIFVSFGLWYDTEPQWDWMYFCASIDGTNYSCDYWSGYSGGWTDQAYWLTSYAGYSQVWLAWVFKSDETVSTGYEGPFVDEIWVWGNDISAPPPPTPPPDPAGQLIQNGSFETGDLPPWESLSPSSTDTLADRVERRPSLRLDGDRGLRSSGESAAEGTLGIAEVGVTDASAADGLHSAYLTRDGTGNDYLYQTFNVPSGVTGIVLDYWFAVTTAETGVGRDFFCASLRPAELSTIWVDLGCIDSIDTTRTGYWQEVIYTLTSDEVALVADRPTALIFELYNTGPVGTWTTGWVDYVRVYATGGGAAGSIDPNEPNNDTAHATTITCGQTINTGVIGDALGGYDVDWFKVSNVPQGRLDVDITARTKMPPSALDSVVGLWDGSVNLLTWNDDDGITYDSYVVYTNTTSNATFYISVESYSGYGSPDSFYDLTVQCAGTGGGSPTGGNEQPPADNTWTVMLYLNAEDSNFEDILTQYRTDIEDFIGSKSRFLTVTILYDGPDANDTTRYLVQPNSSYTPGVNQWNMGELNMGDANTLANFVTWAMDQYPAENYYLSIDDHGNGVYGISWDQTSGDDPLRPDEVYTALKAATYNGDPNRRIDILDYEACLMGLAENAYDVRDWAEYVVFSEQISWGINTYPVYFSDLAAADTPLTVGQRIVDRYHAQAMVADGHGYPHTISLIDTSKMGNVRSAVSNFGNALMTTGLTVTVKSARNSSQAFAADDDATNPMRAEYIDLWDLADKASSLAPTQATAVKSAVTTAVIREQHASGRVSIYTWDHSRAHGLSIYYPPSKASNAFDAYVATSPYLYQMSREGTWDEFLQWAVPGSARRGMSANRAGIKLAEEGDAYVFKYVYLPAVLKMH